MGQRTYLIRSSLNRAEVLAEASDLLPFFWLTLIRQEDLEAKVSEMRKAGRLMEDEDEKAYENYQVGHHGASNIKIGGTQALANAKSAIPFITLSFPHVAELFSDFIGYLDQHLRPNDSLELDIIALAGFTDMASFIQNLRGDLKEIQEQRAETVSGYFEGDVKYTLTGYAGEFEKHSIGFKKIAEVKNQVRPKPYAKRVPLTIAQLRSRRIKAALLLLIGLGITIASVLYMKRHGISFSFSIWVLVGSGCIGFSIEKIISKTNHVR